MMLIDFFKSVCEGKVSEDKIHSEVKKITKNFNPDKVYELHNKFNDFLDQYDFSYKTKIINNIPLLDDTIAENIESFNDFLFSLISERSDKYRVTSEAELLLNREIFQEFEKINKGELSEIEKIHFIEKTTDLKEDKLNALFRDLKEFIFIKKKLLDDSITNNQIEDIIDHYKNTNTSIPLILEIYDAELGKWRERSGDEVLDITSKDFCIEDYLDLEAIFYPNKFHHINEFEAKLSKIIDEKCVKVNTSRNKNKFSINPIHWFKGEESLRQFIDSLKSAGLIENRETDDIIEEHFYVDSQEPTKQETTKEPQPIIWKSKKVLLAHLIGGLDSSVKTDHLWKDLAPHFHWKGKAPTGLRQSHHSNPYPNNIDVIKDILKKIKESK